MTMPAPNGRPTAASDDEHTLKNHLAIILGYCDLLLSETSATDPRRADLLEIQQAAKSAFKMVDGKSEA